MSSWWTLDASCCHVLCNNNFKLTIFVWDGNGGNSHGHLILGTNVSGLITAGAACYSYYSTSALSQSGREQEGFHSGPSPGTGGPGVAIQYRKKVKQAQKEIKAILERSNPEMEVVDDQDFVE
ncbi:hypothetical protein JOM56_001114 [Amanita muscaria]